MGNRKEETNTSGVELPIVDKFAVGYWYNFSKRTKFMPTIAYERLSRHRLSPAQRLRPSAATSATTSTSRSACATSSDPAILPRQRRPIRRS